MFYASDIKKKGNKKLWAKLLYPRLNQRRKFGHFTFLQGLSFMVSPSQHGKFRDTHRLFFNSVLDEFLPYRNLLLNRIFPILYLVLCN